MLMMVGFRNLVDQEKSVPILNNIMNGEGVYESNFEVICVILSHQMCF